jgi:hypothetical protein
MTDETFTLTIEMGNAAMDTREDLASALEKVAEKLRNGRDGGSVVDENGNTVGTFELA